MRGRVQSVVKPIVRDAVGWALDRARVTRPRPDRFTVVTFHRVLPASLVRAYPLAPLAVTPEAFRWFLEWFGARYTCGPLDETWRRFREGERPDRPFLAITFDDGQRDNALYARPELERQGMRASFFLPVEAIENGTALWHDRLAYAAQALLSLSPEVARGRFAEVGVREDAPDPAGEAVIAAKRLDPEARAAWVAEIEALSGADTRPSWDGMMSWDQARSMAEAGHEIGSHSMTHQLLPQLRGEALEHEVSGSKRVIEQRLQREVRSFCYPNGDHDDAVLDAVGRAGYRQAVTTKWGPNDAHSRPLALTRCDVQTDSARSAVGSLSGARMAWRLSPYFTVP